VALALVPAIATGQPAKTAVPIGLPLISPAKTAPFGPFPPR
jgi:hypothetical protein